MCEKKVCTKCKIEKDLSEFSYRNKPKKLLKQQCKSCDKDYALANRDKKRLWKEKNRERIREQDKEYTKANKDKIKRRRDIWTEKNKDRIREVDKKYREKNKEKERTRGKEWRKNNKPYRNKQERDRKNSDPLYKLSCNIRNITCRAYTSNGWGKKTRTQEILGCDFTTFEQHLNYNPYGFKVGDSDLHLDHIVPISSAITEEELLALNHYTNFQLLPSVYNRDIKSDKPWDKDHFENWLSEKYSWR